MSEGIGELQPLSLEMLKPKKVHIDAAGRSVAIENGNADTSDNAILVLKDKGVFGVFRGQGEHKAAIAASRAVRSYVAEHVVADNVDATSPYTEESMETALLGAGELLRDKTPEHDMRAMATVACINKTDTGYIELVLGSIGTTRAYRLRGESLVRISQDHSDTKATVEERDKSAQHLGDIGIQPQIVAFPLEDGDRIILVDPTIPYNLVESQIKESAIWGDTPSNAVEALLHDANAEVAKGNSRAKKGDMAAVVIDVVSEEEKQARKVNGEKYNMVKQWIDKYEGGQVKLQGGNNGQIWTLGQLSYDGKHIRVHSTNQGMPVYMYQEVDSLVALNRPPLETLLTDARSINEMIKIVEQSPEPGAFFNGEEYFPKDMLLDELKLAFSDPDSVGRLPGPLQESLRRVAGFRKAS